MTATLTLAQALIQRPSITPDDQGCQQLLAERLLNMGFEVTHFPIEGVQNLWAKRGNGAPFLCFAGHTDVVPPGPLSAWHTPPFEPTVANGFLYGRGAADMKSSLAAMITACERFFTHYPDSPGSLAFLITSDEEGPADNGTQAVLKALAKQQTLPQWCIVGEASSEKKLGDTLKIGRRGSITGKLTIKGKQGHVAYPNLANNPIALALKPLVELVHHTWPTPLTPFPATSLQFSNIHAGTGAANVIPGELETIFNVRFAPPLTASIIQTTIQSILTAAIENYTLEWHIGGQPFYTPPTSSLVQTVSQCLTQHLGYSPQLSTTGGTSDGRFFAQYGCEVLEMGPCNATIHQANERIGVQELEQLSQLYEKILKALLRR